MIADSSRNRDAYSSSGIVAVSSRETERRGGIVIPEGPTLYILRTSFIVTKSSIKIAFETSEGSRCQVYGEVFDPEEMSFALWYSNAVEHGTEHSHQKEGLVPATAYAIRIYATTDEGAAAWAPSAAGYFVVGTADASGAGGGMGFTAY